MNAAPTNNVINVIFLILVDYLYNFEPVSSVFESLNRANTARTKNNLSDKLKKWRNSHESNPHLKSQALRFLAMIAITIAIAIHS